MTINIPNMVVQRLKSVTPEFRGILKKKESENSNEADTADIVIDMLEKVFGFKRIEDIRREFPIQGGKCDIAVMLKKKLAYLIEVKRIGTELKDNHVNQAVSYASRAGVENVVLTNGKQWQVYRVIWRGKIVKNLLFKVDFLNLNLKRKEQLEHLFSLSSHGVQKSTLDEVYKQSQVLNKYTVGNLLLEDPVLEVVRREMRRLTDSKKIFTLEQIKQMLRDKVIRRELLDEDGKEDARKLIKKASRKQKKTATNKTTGSADKNNTEPVKRRIFGGILG